MLAHHFHGENDVRPAPAFLASLSVGSAPKPGNFIAALLTTKGRTDARGDRDWAESWAARTLFFTVKIPPPQDAQLLSELAG